VECFTLSFENVFYRFQSSLCLSPVLDGQPLVRESLASQSSLLRPFFVLVQRFVRSEGAEKERPRRRRK